MAGPIRISILANARNATANIRSAETALGRLNTRFSKLKAPAIALGVGIVALGGGMLKLAKDAAEDQHAQTVLAKTLKNSAGATDAQVRATESYISRIGVATGVTDNQMRPALANLVRATHDVGKAQNLMGLAMDVSAGTGRDLGAVSLALAKAHNGQTVGLSKLGIATKDASGKALTFDQITKNLAKTFGGQAAASAGTLEGKWRRLRLIASETGEAIGAKVIPILTVLATFLLNKVGPALSRAGAFFTKNLLPPLKTFGTFVVGTVVPAVVALVKSFGGGVVTAARNLAVVFGPLAKDVANLAVKGFGVLRSQLQSSSGILNVIGRALVGFTGFLRDNATLVRSVAVGIGAVVAAMVLWKTVIGTVSAVTKAFTAVQAALNIVMALNPIGLVVLALVALAAGVIYAYKHSEKFRNIVNGLWGAIRSVAGAIAGAFTTAVRAVGTAIGAIVNFIGSRWKLLPLLLLGPIGLTLFIFKGLPGKILKAVGNLAGLLVQKGRGLLVGLARGYLSYVSTVARFFGGIARSVLRWIGTTTRTLYSKGRGFIVGMVTGTVSYFATLAATFARIPAAVGRFIGTTTGALVQKGRGFIVGLARGVASYFGALASLVASVGGRAVRAVGNLGGLLVGAGRALVGGLISGITQRIGDVAAAASRLAQTIKDHLPGSPVKVGPLRAWNNGGAGKRLVDSVITGLRARRTALQRELNAISRMIDAGMTVDAATGRVPAAVGAGGGLLLTTPGAVAPVIINVSVLTGGPEAGRAVKQALQDYEAINGTGWRQK